MGARIGIDLGTTNSCVAFWDGRAARVIPNREGERTTPSIVSIDHKNHVLVGAAARRQAASNPKATIFAAKRLIGRKHDAPELVGYLGTLPYSVVASPNGDAWIAPAWSEPAAPATQRPRSPEEISSLILKELKAIAEDVLRTEVTGATVTVPAYFNDNQRQATKDAGELAGLTVENILNEPTAAALAYGVSQETDQTFAVFDLGGGTFDISILRKTADVFEVLATSGDTFLGGNDFDARVLRYLIEKLRSDSGIDAREDAAVLYRLTEAAEHAKRQLSGLDATAISLPFLTKSARGPVHLSVERFPRVTLERMCADLIARLEAPCKTALESAKLKVTDIDQVLLVGGMTRMPAVREKVRAIFRGAKVRTDLNPDETVALGAACQCAILSGEIDQVALLDVTPYALGVRVLDSRMSVVIPKNCAIPTSATKRFATTKDKQTEVRIDVFQGDGEDVSGNSALGSFVLEGLPKLAAGQAQVDVSFNIDADGILNVTAKEPTTGKETTVRIHPASGLHASDRQRIRADQSRMARG